MKLYFLILPLIWVGACAIKSRELKENVDGSQSNVLDTASIAMAADLFYQTNRYEDALKNYSALLKVDSNRGLFLYRTAFCLAKLDQTYEAIQYFEKTLQTKYREYDCYYSIGVLYAGKVENDSLTIFYLEKSLTINPESEEARNLLKALNGSNTESEL